jgi:hypothetical protein
MKSRFAIIMAAVFLAGSAFADHYTREQLEQKSKAELIGIILYLQDGGSGGGGGGGCREYNPLEGETGSILTVVRNPGYSNHGTLKWPDGSVFMKRNSGYNNDKELYYPGGDVMVKRNKGYSNDQTVFWPNGATMLLRNNGYANDGSIFRADRSVWLKRNRGYSDDRQRYGLPVEQYHAGDASVRARLTDDDSVSSTTRVSGQGWSVEVTVTGPENDVVVRECL